MKFISYHCLEVRLFPFVPAGVYFPFSSKRNKLKHPAGTPKYTYLIRRYWFSFTMAVYESYFFILIFLETPIYLLTKWWHTIILISRVIRMRFSQIPFVNQYFLIRWVFSGVPAGYEKEILVVDRPCQALLITTTFEESHTNRTFCWVQNNSLKVLFCGQFKYM